jgi:hypothetical protein
MKPLVAQLALALTLVAFTVPIDAEVAGTMSKVSARTNRKNRHTRYDNALLKPCSAWKTFVEQFGLWQFVGARMAALVHCEVSALIKYMLCS